MAYEHILAAVDLSDESEEVIATGKPQAVLMGANHE